MSIYVSHECCSPSRRPPKAGTQEGFLMVWARDSCPPSLPDEDEDFGRVVLCWLLTAWVSFV